MSIATKLFTQAWDSYELLDAGGGKKLERFGSVTTIRPELQAYFKSDTFCRMGEKSRLRIH